MCLFYWFCLLLLFVWSITKLFWNCLSMVSFPIPIRFCLKCWFLIVLLITILIIVIIAHFQSSQMSTCGNFLVHWNGPLALLMLILQTLSLAVVLMKMKVQWESWPSPHLFMCVSNTVGAADHLIWTWGQSRLFSGSPFPKEERLRMPVLHRGDLKLSASLGSLSLPEVDKSTQFKGRSWFGPLWKLLRQQFSMHFITALLHLPLSLLDRQEPPTGCA